MEPDVHPSPDEIKPYVAVGPTENLSFTVHKGTFDSSFLVGMIFIALIFMVAVVLLIFFALEQAKLPPPPPPLNPNATPDPMHANIGASATPTAMLMKKVSVGPDAIASTKQACAATPHAVWIEDGCMCRPPFFGPHCSQEKHDSKFFAVGVPDEETIHMAITNEEIASGKSFSEQSCSNKCQNTPGCNGFIYHRYSETSGMCTVLEQDVTVPEGTTIPYDPHGEATLYLRSSVNLHFQNRIFLGIIIPARFWLAPDSPTFMSLRVNEIQPLSFTPIAIKMPGPYTGIYCKHKFTSQDISILLARGSTSSCYIHRPGTQLSIPSDWKYRLQDKTLSSLYVVYV
jgi:hypothetical protein